MTYDRAIKLRRLVAELPLESFVLETDSPDMPLLGYQGQVNYPERVSKVAAVVAKLRQQPLKEVIEVTAAQSVMILRSEEHTSELQSHHDLVCRLLLEKKKY